MAATGNPQRTDFSWAVAPQLLGRLLALRHARIDRENQRNLRCVKLFGSIDYHTSRLIRWTRLQNVAHRTTAFPFQSTAGYPIEATLTLPTAGTAPFPVAILCPGIDDDGTVFTSLQTPFIPQSLCQMGIAALHFDPTGRGKSWGEEDFGAQNIKIWFLDCSMP